MAAVFPGGIKSWTTPVVDNVDTVYAAHVNDLRNEVVAVEDTLGVGLKTSSWSADNTDFTTSTSAWGNLATRLTNIERGLVTKNDVHTQYLKKAGDTMSGSLVMSATIAMSNNKITGLANGTASTDALAYGQVLASSSSLISALFSGTSPTMNGTAAVGTSAQPSRSDHVHPTDTSRLAKAGDTMTGTLTMSGATIAMGGNKITGLPEATANGEAVRYNEFSPVQAAATNALPKAGGTMTGTLTMSGATIAMGSNKITGLANGTSSADAVNKSQLDLKLSKSGSDTMTGNLVISKESPDLALYANNNTSGRVAYYSTGSILRWTAEMAADTNYKIVRWGGASLLSIPFEISNSTGDVNVNGMLFPQGVRFSDGATPESQNWGADNARRWLYYDSNGRLTRIMDAFFRIMVFSIANSSSQRFKENIEAAEQIPDITSLTPKTYEWKPDGMRETLMPGQRLGFIAEEVAAVDDRLVTKDAEGQVTGLDTAALIAALIDKVTELQHRVEELEAQ